MDDGSNWSDWKTDGLRGPLPVRRGFRTSYLVTSLTVFAALLAIFWLAFSGRLS
jgi:hypothetical protein